MDILGLTTHAPHHQSETQQPPPDWPRLDCCNQRSANTAFPVMWVSSSHNYLMHCGEWRASRQFLQSSRREYAGGMPNSQDEASVSLTPEAHRSGGAQG